MPAPSDAERQQRILWLVGDIDPATGDSVLPDATGGPTGLVARNITRLYAYYWDETDPRLQDHYVARDAIEMILMALRPQYDVDIDQNEVILKRSQQVKPLLDLLDKTTNEIKRLETQRSASGASVGALTRTAPVMPPVFEVVSPYPDANDARYAGSPYWRSVLGRAA